MIDWTQVKTAEDKAAESHAAAMEAYIANRQRAYREESDPLFLQWQRGEATEQEWLDAIADIKARYPKPDVAVS